MIRPTRRGVALLLVAGVATGLAVAFGARSLGAIVVPSAVALVAGVVQVWLTPTPAVERADPPDGHADREAGVTLRFDVDDPFPATVDDRLSPGVVAVEGLPAEAVVGEEAVHYRLRFERRGKQTVGPATVRYTDVLGLVAARTTAGTAASVLVYPPVRPLPPTLDDQLRAGVAGQSRTERDEFDGLREYVRGDALRNLNWKASAKRDDLIVTEFTGARPARTVTVAVGGAPEDVSEMATAAASVVAALHDLGAVVALRTPDGEVEAGPDAPERAFEHLATVGPGAVPDGEAAVRVEASGGEARVSVAGEERVAVGGDRRATA
ncbi:MAG: DUF58 domain-containing protein [Haloferacaceae archaeon]